MNIDTGLRIGTYYNPLPNILWYDKFDNGLHGWAAYRDTKGKVYAGLLPAEVSTGSHERTTGGLTSEKVMVIEQGTAIKRTSWLWKGRVRWESWLVVKNHKTPSEFGPDIGTLDFVLIFDSQIGIGEDKYRAHYGIKYQNTDSNGNLVQKWNYAKNEDNDIHNYVPFPNEPEQELTYNEKYKYDWMYVRLDIDIGKHEYVEFQCNDRIWDLRGIQVPACSNCSEGNVLSNLLNCAYGVRGRQIYSPSTMYIDSVILSAEGNNGLGNLEFNNLFSNIFDLISNLISQNILYVIIIIVLIIGYIYFNRR